LLQHIPMLEDHFIAAQAGQVVPTGWRMLVQDTALRDLAESL